MNVASYFSKIIIIIFSAKVILFISTSYTSTRMYIGVDGWVRLQMMKIICDSWSNYCIQYSNFLRYYKKILIFLFFLVGFAGTPGYLSPEVLKKEPYGKPVDIWACGK